MAERRTAQVLVTLTDDDDGDMIVSLDRVGGDDKGWAIYYVGDMFAAGYDTSVESVTLDGGIRITP